MKPISQFGTSIKLTALIADLRRTVRSLDISIEYEKDRARSSQAPYPIAIRHLKARRDKLLLTISSLALSLQASSHLAPATVAGSRWRYDVTLTDVVRVYRRFHCPEM